MSTSKVKVARAGGVVALSALGVVGAQGVAATDLPTGEIVDRVTCRGTATQSYALYLPSGYTADRPWPVLYAMDPRKRGRLPVELFREAAERYGYILIGSNNTMSDRASAMRENMRALTVLWKDTHQRFAVDDRRAYLTGMSGGARAACLRADVGPEPIAGVIACAAGFSSARAPHAELDFSIFGAIGNADYNFYELVAMEETLDSFDVPNRMVSFDGPHGWPTPDVAMEAIEWLEVRALKEGRRPADPAHAAELLAVAMKRVAHRSSGGDIIGASAGLADIVRDFEGLTDLTQPRREWEAMKDSKQLRRSIDARRKALEHEKRYREKTQQRAFSGVTEENAAKSVNKILDRLEVDELKELAASDDREKSLSGKRLLSTVLGQTSFYIPTRFEAEGSFARAALSLEVANEIRPGQPYVLYRLARVQALAGRGDDAVRSLSAAISAGYDPTQMGGSPDSVERDPGFASLTERSDFRELVNGLKESPSSH